MNLEIAVIIAQALLKYGPTTARELVALFSKAEITQADWDKVFLLAEKSYDDYVKPVG